MNYTEKDSWNTPHEIVGHMPFENKTDEKRRKKIWMMVGVIVSFFRSLQCPQVHMLFYSDNICDISFFDESAQN